MLLQLRHVVRQLTLRVVASSALRQLPILRGLLLKLNTVSCGRRTLAHYVPLRLNVEFHKLLALVVGGLAFFHVFAHFMNFAEAPVVTLNLFPSTVNPPWFGVVRYAPWVTGGLITWSMFYIYSAAPQLVRRAKYEVFWWNHHFFVLFYVAQIFHGPRFLYWTILPILLYILERILRVRRGRRKVYVKSVKWIDPYVAHVHSSWRAHTPVLTVVGRCVPCQCDVLGADAGQPSGVQVCGGPVYLPQLPVHFPQRVAPVHHLVRCRRPRLRRPRVDRAHPRVPEGVDGQAEGLLWAHEPSEPVRER